MAFDSDREVVLLFGGHGAESDVLYGDTWQWNGVSWTLLDSGDPDGITAPKPRNFVEMVYDSHRQVVVLFGGALNAQGGGGANGETWEWDGDQWSQRSTSGPEPRVMFAIAYDPIDEVTVLLGGTNSSTVLERV